jgi:hypothetical protein
MPKLNKRAKLGLPLHDLFQVLALFSERWAKLSGQFSYPTIEMEAFLQS